MLVMICSATRVTIHSAPLSPGTESMGSVYAIATRTAASRSSATPQITVVTVHMRRKRGDRCHSWSHDSPLGGAHLRCRKLKTLRPSSNGRENRNVSGRVPRRLMKNHPPHAAVSTPVSYTHLRAHE